MSCSTITVTKISLPVLCCAVLSCPFYPLFYQHRTPSCWSFWQYSGSPAPHTSCWRVLAGEGAATCWVLMTCFPCWSMSWHTPTSHASTSLWYVSCQQLCCVLFFPTPLFVSWMPWWWYISKMHSQMPVYSYVIISLLFIIALFAHVHSHGIFWRSWCVKAFTQLSIIIVFIISITFLEYGCLYPPTISDFWQYYSCLPWHDMNAAYYVTSMGAAVEFIDTTYATEKEDFSVDDDDDQEREKDAEDYRKEMLNIEEMKMKEKELGEAAVNHLGKWFNPNILGHLYLYWLTLCDVNSMQCNAMHLLNCTLIGCIVLCCAVLRYCALRDSAVLCAAGEWLRDQQVMEDTMVVMMQEGWMGWCFTTSTVGMIVQNKQASSVFLALVVCCGLWWVNRSISCPCGVNEWNFDELHGPIACYGLLDWNSLVLQMYWRSFIRIVQHKIQPQLKTERGGTQWLLLSSWPL